MMLNDNEVHCDICDIVPTKSYRIKKKIVCRFCKKHHEKEGHFPRRKIHHNYKIANALIEKFHKEVFPEYEKRRLRLEQARLLQNK